MARLVVLEGIKKECEKLTGRKYGMCLTRVGWPNGTVQCFLENNPVNRTGIFDEVNWVTKGFKLDINDYWAWFSKMTFGKETSSPYGKDYKLT